MQWLSNYDLCSGCHAKPEAAEKAPYAEVYMTTLRGALQGLSSKNLHAPQGLVCSTTEVRAHVRIADPAPRVQLSFSASQG